jgi:hypothetical protein
VASFYLGVWHSPKAISDDEAAVRYRALSDGKSTSPEFDSQVYAFYFRLTDLYPEIDMVPEAELDTCPWDCAIDMSGGHVIMAIRAERVERLLPEVLALAEQHGLVCFDPQAGRAHLPPDLRARRSRGT